MVIVKVTATVEVPKIPNFLRMSDGQTLSLGAISDVGLREVGQEWTESLLVRAKEQRLKKVA